MFCHLLDSQMTFMDFDFFFLLLFPVKIWGFGSAYKSFTLPTLPESGRAEISFICTILFITHCRKMSDVLKFLDPSKAKFLQ